MPPAMGIPRTALPFPPPVLELEEFELVELIGFSVGRGVGEVVAIPSTCGELIGVSEGEGVGEGDGNGLGEGLGVGLGRTVGLG